MTFVWYAGLLDLALNAAQLHHAAAFAKALFLLRNLALAAENKVHFVTNLQALPVCWLLLPGQGTMQRLGRMLHLPCGLWCIRGKRQAPWPLSACCLSINQTNLFMLL